MSSSSRTHVDLQAATHQLMVEKGFSPDFSPEVARQLAELTAHPPRVSPQGEFRDMRNLLWSSIDNDTSKDLDQIEVAEKVAGAIRVLVGVADVDAWVPQGSPIDRHAAEQTTTVYAGVRNFPMLPEPLSNNLTSLVEAVDKLAVVIEFVVSDDGSINSGTAYRAVVRNSAQLAYNAAGSWLEGNGPAPAKVAQSPDLQAQLRLQDEAAQLLRAARSRSGALNLETIETEPITSDGLVTGISQRRKNRATELIEDFMVATNGVIARMLLQKHVSSIRRVVKTPERWSRIVELAAQKGEQLPADPDSGALSAFLTRQKKADPAHFPDLSLAVVKLMGPGEYVLERPGDPELGHFGLAVQDYTHSTAPNRRFADLVTQRLVKAVLANQPPPYSDGELEAVASNCTQKEDAARKVERGMVKRIAAVALSGKIGQVFDAVVTGVTPQGTYVRTVSPPVEGRLMQGEAGVDVGDQFKVKLLRTDPFHGYIDFQR